MVPDLRHVVPVRHHGGDEVLLAIIGLHRRHLILLQLGLAPIVLLHFVGLLRAKRRDHAVNRLLHLREGVELHA
eukprot:2979203-Heterocapsa_arctica.AAC.1